MIRKISHLFLYLILASSLVFSACSDEPESSTSRLRISLTDAASVSLRELGLDIRKIEVATRDSLGTISDWIELEYKAKTYDVLRYMNGKSVQIVDQFFPSGSLYKIKLYFGPDSYVVTVSDKGFEPNKLNIDEHYQSNGLELDVNRTIYPHRICSIMLDINVFLSIASVNDKYFFFPNIRVFAEEDRGAIKGVVGPPQANAYVLAIQEPDTLMTWPEADGMFMFTGLQEGKWEIHAVPSNPQSLYYPTKELSDSVKKGQTLSFKTITLSVEPPTTEPEEGGGEG